MSLTVKESIIIRPLEPTRNHRLWLSHLDYVGSTHAHVPVIYTYTQTNSKSSSSSKVLLETDVMKESLSKVLVPFYPVAGRLAKNETTGRIEIDCNASGVLFEEAEATHPLSHYGDQLTTKQPNLEPEVRKLVLPTPCDYSGGLSSFPLLLVRLTRFECGGVCVAFVTHHFVADGIGHTYFFNSWATIARGDKLQVMPVHERSFYLSPRDPLSQIKFNHIQFEPPLPPLQPNALSDKIATTTDGLFNFTKHQIDALKLQAISPEIEGYNYKPSTFEVLAGHVWRSTTKARGLTGDQGVKLYILTDGRSRLKDPTLPEGYFGNVIMKTVCIAKAKDIVCKPLWYAANLVHGALKRVEDSEYWKSAIDHLETQPNVMAPFREGKAITCPNLVINSFGRIPLNEADFGWGKPIFVGYVALKGESYTYLLPNPSKDGSFLLDINLFTVHMSNLKKYLYDF